jgi:dynactin 1
MLCWDRLRDTSAHEKHQHQKTLKEAEAHKAEAAELSRTKERLEIRCQDLEHQVSELQEMVSLTFAIKIQH